MKNTYAYSERGFSALEIILGIAMIAVIGVAGYYAYANHTNHGTAYSTITPSPSSKATLSPSPTNPMSYLSVKEWGVKIPQLPSNNVLSYEYSNDLISIVSTEQKALGGECGTFGSARYHVSREPKDYQPPAESQMKTVADDGNTVTIGNYTYYIVTDMSGGWCEAGDPAPGASMPASETTANNHLLADLKGLVSE